MQGPFPEDMNRAMLRRTGASWLLAKESGGNSGFAEKLSAAALENAAVVVVRQPREDGGLAMDELQEIITGQKREAPRSVPAPPVRAAAPSGLPGAAEKLRWFPFFLDILNKRVVIAGGGAIALRRVTTLLRFDCAIEIIAPALHGELAALAAANPDYVSVDLRPFEDGDCHGDYLLALTDDRELNHRISLECRKKGIPVSVADRREESTFYFPAVILWDKIVAALSSDGRDHALVKKTADRLRNIIEEGGVHG
jgi:precorrin-2 dehydrogenase/sirohydrochlorin ferrochelatase/precorrin-6A/cobalt-precorrin-6A reductase